MSEVLQHDCTVVFNYTCVLVFYLSFYISVGILYIFYCVTMDRVSELTLH